MMIDPSYYKINFINHIFIRLKYIGFNALVVICMLILDFHKGATTFREFKSFTVFALIFITALASVTLLLMALSLLTIKRKYVPRFKEGDSLSGNGRDLVVIEVGYKMILAQDVKTKEFIEFPFYEKNYTLSK